MLGVPARSGTVELATLYAAMDSFTALLARGDVLVVQGMPGLPSVEMACNVLVAMFLDSDCTDLVLMGDDQGWDGTEFAKLCAYDADIVGVGVIMKGETERYTCILDADEIQADANGLVEVFTVGSGYLRIRRNVLEHMANASEWYHCAQRVKTVPRIFERRVIDGVEWSEDNTFCLKAKELGYKILVDPEMHTEHIGKKSWHGHMGDYWRACNAPNDDNHEATS